MQVIGKPALFDRHTIGPVHPLAHAVDTNAVLAKE